MEVSGCKTTTLPPSGRHHELQPDVIFLYSVRYKNTISVKMLISPSTAPTLSHIHLKPSQHLLSHCVFVYLSAQWPGSFQRQQRILLSQQYLGTLKAPHSQLDWHVWPAGMLVTCLASRHPWWVREKCLHMQLCLQMTERTENLYSTLQLFSCFEMYCEWWQ